MIDKPKLQHAFETAIDMAVRAPSIHNTQPWRWRVTADAVHLYADTSRHLPATDPTGRALVMSCGAALHHLRVGLAMLGWHAGVRYVPDPGDPDLLAVITATPRAATPADIESAAAIMHRQSDRRAYDPRPVNAAMLRGISSVAPAFGAAARLVPPQLRGALAEATHTAVARHARDGDYQREITIWSGRHGDADGVPAANTPPIREDGEILLRAFADPELADPADVVDGAQWFVIGTPTDDTQARVRAGEAVSAILLTATRSGLASCIQSEPLGILDLGADLRSEVLHDCAFAQTMIRIGWAPRTAAPLPFTPRRPSAEVVDEEVVSS
ncbi:Acg family FMN-binding oxidoreductase [Nocardia sp. NPDC005978]|uniref:Acg family FMN-binding oxidoreductase n=1 Tax=unclassified Nocardia TaxID=2637762 RepID=UPI0033B37BA7